MRFIFFSSKITILLCFIIWPLLQVASALVCLKIKDARLSYRSFFYKCYSWENDGKIYKKIFKVHIWKKLLPDGGAIVKNGFKKRHLESFSKENLENFMIESCRAELSHWISIAPFWIFGFFAPPEVPVYMFIYAIFLNMPCIIAQRYNRPRISKLIEKIESDTKNNIK